MMRAAVVCGNPKPQSRTLAAASYVARELTGLEPDLVVDLATLGPALLDSSDPTVAGLVDEVTTADLVVVASPTYKSTYTGLLKVFLDRFGAGSVRGVAVPLMLGGSPAHSLAPELSLRPVLTEIGLGPTLRGLYVVDAAHDDPSAYAHWLATQRPLLAALTGAQV